MKKEGKNQRKINPDVSSNDTKLSIFLFFSFVFIMLLSVSSLAALDVALSDQGTGARDKSTGQLLSQANLTVEVYDALTGGALVYSETFTNGITNGSWNVMIGETSSLPLEYGKVYYRDYKINGEDASFTNGTGGGVGRQFFYSPLGDINGSKLINSSMPIEKLEPCSEGQILKIVSGVWVCATDNSGNSTDTVWNIATSNYIINQSGILYVNESKLNATIDARDTLNQLSCSNNQIAKWNSTSSAWECESDETGNADLSNYALKNQSETFAGNITTSQTGFFGWLGSLASRITKLFVVDIDASGNINASNYTLNGTTIDDWSDVQTPDTNTHVAGDGNYLYNDSATMHFNETKLNATIDARQEADGQGINASTTKYLHDDGVVVGFNETELNATIIALENNTLYYVGGIYIYNNGSNWFYLNETKLNETIDSRRLLNDTNGIYIYDNGRKIYLNETKLNATIDSIASLYNGTSWVLSQGYLVNDSSARFSSLFVATNLIYADNGTIGFKTSTVGNGYDFDFNGNVRIQGDLDVVGNFTSLSVQNLLINGSIVPEQDAMFDIGNSTRRFRNGSFSGSLDIGSDVIVNGQSVCLEDGTNCLITADNDTTYSHLSNFTDDLGNRGYTSLSNFTNDKDFINSTQAEMYNNSARIDSLNASKLDITDQRYNDTALINAVNSTANIKDLGFNTTAELDNKYIAQNEESNLNVNSSSWWNSVSGWVASWFYVGSDNVSLALNETKLNESIDARTAGLDTQKSGGGSYLYNDSNAIYVNETALNATIDSRDDDTTYTHLSNFTDDVLWTSGFNSTGDSRWLDDTQKGTSGKYVYNDSANIMFNETELNATINALENDTLAGLSCSANQIAKWNGTVWLCANETVAIDTQKSAGSAYLYNDSSSIYLNETILNATIDARDDDTTYSHLSNFTNDKDFINSTQAQVYNDTAKIDAVNKTANIKNLGFNTTAELDSKYINQSEESNLNVNSSTWWNSVSGWVASWFHVASDNVSLTLNETKLNESIDARTADLDTQKGTSGKYLYNDSANIMLNETELNATIDARDDDTHKAGNGIYLYNDSATMYLNETKLNATINDLENDTLAGLSCSADQIAKWNGSIWQCSNETVTTDTQKSTNGFYLYNDSTAIYFNETKLNATIIALENNTLYYAGSVYIYNNGSNWFYLNETRLNETIDSIMLLNDTNGVYIYDNGRKIYLNETRLNATVDSIASLYNETSWVLSQGYLVNDSSARFSSLFVDTNLIYADNGSIGFKTSTVGNGFDFDFNGNVRIQGDLDVVGNFTSLSVQNLLINGSLLPEQDAMFDIGNSTRRFRNATFSDSISVGNDVIVNGQSVCLEDGTNCYLGTSINNTELESNSVNTSQIIDGQVQTLDIADGNVTNAKIDSVNWSKITSVPAGIEDGDNDTHVAGNGIYLYNDSTTMYFNETKLNETIDDKQKWERNETGNYTYSANSQDNVGIGVNNPQSKLEIRENSTGGDGQLFITDSTDNTRQLRIGYDTTDNYGFIRAIEVGAAERNLILQEYGGRVGIGTDSPNERLAVVGNTNITGNLNLGEKITFALGEIIDNIADSWLRITGNLNVTGNLSIGENIIATGNTTASYFFGDGSQLSNIYGKTQTFHHDTASTLEINDTLNNAEIHIENNGNLTINGSKINSDTFQAVIISTDSDQNVALTTTGFSGTFLRDGNSDPGFANLTIRPDEAYAISVTDAGGMKFLNVMRISYSNSYNDLLNAPTNLSQFIDDVTLWQNGTYVQLKPSASQNVNFSGAMYVNASSGRVAIGTTNPNAQLSLTEDIEMQSFTPSNTTNKIYGQNGTLYYDGEQVGTGGSYNKPEMITAYFDMRDDPTTTGSGIGGTATLTGSAVYNSTNEWVVLTPNATIQNGNIYWRVSPGESLKVSFDFYIDGVADAVWFFLNGNATASNEGQNIGDGGYIFSFGEWNDRFELRRNGTILAQTGTNTDWWADAGWHRAVITKEGPKMHISVDGRHVLTYQDVNGIEPSGTFIGFGARTGGSTAEHRVRRVEIISPVTPWESNYDISENYGIGTGYNVGIGTTSPGQKLTVVGDANITGNLSAGDGFDFVIDDNTLRLSNATAAYGGFRYNDGSSKLQFSHDNGTSWGNVGSGGLSLGFVNSTATLEADTSYDVDTTSSAFNVTLPDSPDDGTQIRIIDVKGNFGANSLLVLAGGSDTIEGANSTNLTTSNTVTNFFYDATNTRWTIQGDNEEASTQLHRTQINLFQTGTSDNLQTHTITNNDADSVIGSGAKVTFTSSDVGVNIGGIVDVTNNQIEILQAGTYLVDTNVDFASTGAGFRIIQLVKNGNNIIAHSIHRVTPDTDTAGSPFSWIGELAAEDTLDIRYAGTAGTSQLRAFSWSVNQLPTAVITYVNGTNSIPGGSFYGGLRWDTTPNCQWSGTTSAGGIANYSADAECDDEARTAYGLTTSNTAAGNSEGQLPQIRFNSMPSGYYRIVATGMFAATAAGDYHCAWRFATDGGLTTQFSGVNNQNEFVPNIEGLLYVPNDLGATTIQVQFSAGWTTSACEIDVNDDAVDANQDFEIDVFYFPSFGTAKNDTVFSDLDGDTRINVDSAGNDSDNMTFFTDGTQRAVITSDGNVGIGTSTPRGIFDVRAGAGDNVYLTENTTVGTTASVFIPGHVYYIPYGGGDVVYLQARRENNSGTAEIQFRTFNSGSMIDAMRIQGDGDVGIGTGSPLNKLTVANNNVNGVGLELRSDDTTLNSVDYSAARLFANFSSTNYVDSRLFLQTATNENTWKTGLVIKNGSVGIGTTSPNAPLTVQDSGATQNSFAKAGGFYWDTLANTEAILGLSTDDAGSSGEYFIRARTEEDSSGDDEFLFRTNGNANADGSFTGGGADYAEWFITEETIPESSLVGLNLETGKVRVWREGDPLVGVQSVNPGFVGNNIEAENSEEDMLANGYALVGLVGQLHISSPVLEKDGMVYTPDGRQFIGYRLSDGKVFMNRDGGAIQELKTENNDLRSENNAIKKTLCDMGREEWC